jgi:integrase
MGRGCEDGRAPGSKHKWRVPCRCPLKRTVFVLPEWLTKNKEARVVVLNDVAPQLVDGLRSQHPTYVFTWEDRKHRRRRFRRLNNTGWKAARRRAAARYVKELGLPAPDGFRRVRVHDLKHYLPSLTMSGIALRA